MAKFTLTLPDELYEAVQEVAQRHERSATAEIRWALREWVGRGTDGK